MEPNNVRTSSEALSELRNELTILEKTIQDISDFLETEREYLHQFWQDAQYSEFKMSFDNVKKKFVTIKANVGAWNRDGGPLSEMINRIEQIKRSPITLSNNGTGRSSNDFHQSDAFRDLLFAEYKSYEVREKSKRHEAAANEAGLAFLSSEDFDESKVLSSHPPYRVSNYADIENKVRREVIRQQMQREKELKELIEELRKQGIDNMDKLKNHLKDTNNELINKYNDFLRYLINKEDQR